MAAYATPVITHQFFDDAGDPVAAGKVYTYDSGTTTPKTTYTDSAGLVPNTNPIILDSAGRCSLRLGTGEYTIRLETSAGALVRSEDHIFGVASAADIAGKLDSSTAATTYALKNNTTLTGTLSVAGAATLSSTLDVTGLVTLGADATSANHAPRFSQLAGLTMPAFSNLIVSATGANANIAVTADQVILQGTGVAYKASAVSLSISLASSGAANALDVGAVAASTFYYVYVIYNPTTVTVAGLASLSATSPTMPSGYTMKCLVGCVITDATVNKYPNKYKQYGRSGRFHIGANISGYPQIASGALGSTTVPTWSAVSISTLVPSIASHIGILAAGGSNGTVMVAPSNAYGAYNSTSSPPPVVVSIGTTSRTVVPYTMLLESLSNIYYASDIAAGALYYTGWELNL